MSHFVFKSYLSQQQELFSCLPHLLCWELVWGTGIFFLNSRIVNIFFILCNGEPIDNEREHIERKLLDEYKEKFVVDNKNLQDSLDMKNGWVGEDTIIIDGYYLILWGCAGQRKHSSANWMWVEARKSLQIFYRQFF